MSRPVAVLTYNPKTRLPVRTATCPDHDKRSSKFMGEQAELLDPSKHYWVFRCSHGHLFTAEIPHGAPKSVAAAQEWLKKQEAVAAGVSYDSGGR